MTVELSHRQKIWKTRRERYGPSGFSEEGPQKLRKPKSEGRKRKLSETMTGRKLGPFSEEHKRNHSESLPRGPDHWNWNGGRRINNGYVYMLKPDHPNADKAGYVPRSHLVMEERLGRYLEPGEVVHHEGEKTDDRSEMLILFPLNKVHLAYHRSLRN